MTLEEMKAELRKGNVVVEATYCDPCVLRSKHYKARQLERLPKHIVLVEDEDTGKIEYMRLFPDGHLGSLGGE